LQAKERFIKLATSIGELQKSCGVPIPVDDYLATFHFNLMEVVYEWAKGMVSYLLIALLLYIISVFSLQPFSDLMKLTDVQEGIIVRCIQRLDEVLKDVRNAARIIGDPVLYQKMEEASQLIKRDIVFAASLYMS
jgi:antiviral helicase SKI2